MTFSTTLRDRIEIQWRDNGSDESGQATTTWTRLTKAWANKRGAGGLEMIKAGAVTSKVKVSWRMRHRSGITAGMRVVHGATVYNILAVLPANVAGSYIDLACESVT